MDQKLEFDGVSYISSKEAAQITGYTQDYIGQLARGSKIIARRVGGLWYVNLESLSAYKSVAETYVPQPPQEVPAKQMSEEFVSLDGKRFVSSKRGADLSGYNQDYVTQLARSGQIHAQQVGSRWFVDQAALFEHKQHNDSLLRAVQAQSVGLVKDGGDVRDTRYFGSVEPSLRYTAEKVSMMPELDSKPWIERPLSQDETIQKIDVRKTTSSGNAPQKQQKATLPVKRASLLPMIATTGIAALIVSVLATFGFASLNNSSSQFAASIGGSGGTVLRLLDRILADHISFRR